MLRRKHRANSTQPATQLGRKLTQLAPTRRTTSRKTTKAGKQLKQRKKKQRNRRPIAKPPEARPGPGSRNGAAEWSWKALRRLQEGHDAEGADIASPQGKVFTCNPKRTGGEVQEGRLQGGSDIRRRRRLGFRHDLSLLHQHRLPEAPAKETVTKKRR